MIRYVIFTLTLLAAIACGHLRTPVYRGIGGVARDPSGADPRQYRAEQFRYAPKGEFRLYWPVSQVRLNRGFRPSSDRRHEGIDLGGARGSPILAAHEGVVVYAGSGFRGYGKMVLVEYNKEWATLYAHLNSISAREGQVLKARDIIGQMGATGQASGVHLHFELIRHRQPVDPLPVLGRGSRLAGIAH